MFETGIEKFPIQTLPNTSDTQIMTCVVLFSVDLEWKIIYVSSAESEDHDQVLDSVLVGPVPPGKHKFVFQVFQLLYKHLLYLVTTGL